VTVRKELEEYATQVLGPVEVVGDRSWDHSEACVLEVRDRSGATWFAKRSRGERNYRREVLAYQSWVPALGERAPHLRAYDDRLKAVVVSGVRGVLTACDEPDQHHQAGSLLRRFHDSEPPQPAPAYVGQVETRLEHWIGRGGDLIGAREHDFARREVRRLRELPTPVRVPCHGDYTSRNWLIDADGTLRVIDFGHARREVWVNDLSRLYFDQWQHRPDLREAFLTGYGRPLAGDDLALLLRHAVVGAVSGIVWAREHGDGGFEEHHRRMLAGLMRAGRAGKVTR
jgi:Ser/Thr protein kinase RdoA (MazF antagonist)